MSRLKLLPFAKLRRVAERCGFELARRKGSHCTFKRPDGRTLVIPDHVSSVIVRPLLRKIIRDVGLSIDEYNRLAQDL